VDYTFFGVQIAIKAFFKDPMRQQLAKIIAESSADQTLFEKRAFWKRLCAVVNEGMPVFELGYWDLIRGGRAQEEFETWCSEPTTSSLTFCTSICWRRLILSRLPPPRPGPRLGIQRTRATANFWTSALTPRWTSYRARAAPQWSPMDGWLAGINAARGTCSILAKLF